MMRTAPITRKAPLRSDTGEAGATVATRECEVCSKPFFARTTLHVVCSMWCSFKLPAVRAKAERKADKAKREKLKSRAKWEAEAQAACNRFIRARDAGKPCICCGRFSQGAGKDRGGEWDAGHYRSRGAAPELRFDENNIHAQLKQCNRRAWDVATYRANLLERIGPAELERLEGPHPPRKYTVDALKEIRDTYRKREREMVRALETEAA